MDTKTHLFTLIENLKVNLLRDAEARPESPGLWYYINKDDFTDEEIVRTISSTLKSQIFSGHRHENEDSPPFNNISYTQDVEFFDRLQKKNVNYVGNETLLPYIKGRKVHDCTVVEPDVILDGEFYTLVVFALAVRSLSYIVLRLIAENAPYVDYKDAIMATCSDITRTIPLMSHYGNEFEVFVSSTEMTIVLRLTSEDGIPGKNFLRMHIRKVGDGMVLYVNKNLIRKLSFCVDTKYLTCDGLTYDDVHRLDANYVKPTLKFNLLTKGCDFNRHRPLGIYYYVDADAFDIDRVRSDITEQLERGPEAGSNAIISSLVQLKWNKSNCGLRDKLSGINVNYIGRVSGRCPVIWGNVLSNGVPIRHIYTLASIFRTLIFNDKRTMDLVLLRKLIVRSLEECIRNRVVMESDIATAVEGNEVAVYICSSPYKSSAFIRVFSFSAVDGKLAYTIHPTVKEMFDAVIDPSYFEVEPDRDIVVDSDNVLTKSSDLTESQLRVRKVVCAALCYEGVIVAGARHYDLVMQSQLDAIKCDGIRRKWKQGFIDQFGVFLSRREALQVAIDAGQHIDYERNGSTTELYSEGLY